MSREIAGARVLLTGARGFLGSHLARRLADEGAEVHAVSRQPGPKGDRYTWWQNDLGSQAAVERLFAETKPDVVYHLAGHVTAAPGVEHVGPTFDSLLGSAVWVLLASAKAKPRRVVLVGSASETVLRGQDPTPASPYMAAKWAASAYGRMFHMLYDLPVVVARPVMIFGPGQPKEKLLPSVITAMLKGEAPKMSSGRFAPDWLYVDDVIDGLYRAAWYKEAPGANVAIGSGTLTSVRDMVGRAAGLIREQKGSCPEPLFGALPDRPAEDYDPADTDYARAKLGFSATTPVDDGLRRTIAWLEEQLRKA